MAFDVSVSFVPEMEPLVRNPNINFCWIMVKKKKHLIFCPLQQNTSASILSPAGLIFARSNFIQMEWVRVNKNKPLLIWNEVFTPPPPPPSNNTKILDFSSSNLHRTVAKWLMFYINEKNYRYRFLKIYIEN